MWMTYNGGQTFSYADIDFSPTTISMHKTDTNIVLAMDKNDKDKTVSRSGVFESFLFVLKTPKVFMKQRYRTFILLGGSTSWNFYLMFVNFIPLGQWTWCHCVFHGRRDLKAHAVVSLQRNTRATIKKVWWNASVHVVFTCALSFRHHIHSQSGIKFKYHMVA